MTATFRLLIIIAGLIGSSVLFAQDSDPVTLTGISFSEVDDNQTRIDFDTDAPPPEARLFALPSGQQLIIDMPGLINRSGQQYYAAQTGPLDSIMVVSDQERLRVVLNLYERSEHVMRRGPGGYSLMLRTDDTRVAGPAEEAESEPETAPERTVTPAPDPAPAPDSEAAAEPASEIATLPISEGFEVSAIDFHRAADGGGQVLVRLNHPGISTNLFREEDRIIVELPDTRLPEALEQRLDVTDFATPVLTIDSSRDGNGVRLVITAAGRYRHSSIQIDDRLSINVTSIGEAEPTLEERREYIGERISIDLEDIPVRQALSIITEFTGDNLVMSDSVDGQITLRLNDVHWDQALELILQSNGLAQRRTDNILRIAPIEEILESERQALEADQKILDIEPLVTEVLEIKYAEADDIVKALQSGEGNTGNLLSSRGSVTADERTNSLVLQDTASQLSRMHSVIEKLDRPVRQVQIDTRIIEARGDFSKNLGVRLGLTLLQSLGGDGLITQTEVTDESGNVTVTETPDFLNRGGNVQGIGGGSIENTNRIRTDNSLETSGDALSVNLPAGAIGDTPAAQYGLTLGTISPSFIGLLDLEISALQAEANGRVLANPRVLTTNNNEAVIQRGQERTLTIQGGGGDEGATETVEAELSLRVTPQITPDDAIILDVEINNDSFQPSPSGEAVKATQQIITQTLLQNGETVVIGGIYFEGEQVGQAKVPVLGDIPYLGRLFRRDTHTSEHNELLVFLTPQIVEQPIY